MEESKKFNINSYLSARAFDTNVETTLNNLGEKIEGSVAYKGMTFYYNQNKNFKFDFFDIEEVKKSKIRVISLVYLIATILWILVFLAFVLTGLLNSFLQTFTFNFLNVFYAIVLMAFPIALVIMLIYSLFYDNIKSLFIKLKNGQEIYIPYQRNILVHSWGKEEDYYKLRGDDLGLFIEELKKRQIEVK